MLSCHWLACANLEVSLYPIPGILKKQFIEKGLYTMSYLEIEKVIGREIIDSRGNPTVQSTLAEAPSACSMVPLMVCIRASISSEVGIWLGSSLSSSTAAIYCAACSM